MTTVVEYSNESDRASTGLAAAQEKENSQSDSEEKSGRAFLKRILIIATLGQVTSLAFTVIMYFVEGAHEDAEIRKYEETKISAMVTGDLLFFQFQGTQPKSTNHPKYFCCRYSFYSQAELKKHQQSHKK